MTTYTWKIDMMHTLNQGDVQGAVTEVHWSKHGLHPDGIKTRVPGMTKFKISDIIALQTAGNFTPLSQLTEAQVIGWVQASLSKEEKDFFDSQLEQSYQQQIKPNPTGSLEYDTMPWAVTR
jgi:hypothetical protein